MISKLGQVMLYVNNQDDAVKFWTEIMGFHVRSENTEGFRWIEIVPHPSSETSIVLHHKETVAQMNPELNVDTPSLMFFTEDLNALHRDLSEKGVKVGEIVTVPTGRVFNFSDDEENYFAVMEVK